MKKRLDLVLGKSSRPAPVVVPEEDEEVRPQNWGKEVSEFREKAVAASPLDNEEDTLSYFAKLAEED